MAGFCGNCGAARSGGSPFCSACGARQSTPGGASAPVPGSSAAVPPPVQPLPPAAKGSGFKILAVVLAFVVLAGAAAIGGLYYFAHRLKQAVIEKASSAGVDLNSFSSPEASNARIRNYKACELLSKTDAESMLGEPIDRIEDQGGTCLYYGPAGLSGKLAQRKPAPRKPAMRREIAATFLFSRWLSKVATARRK